MQPDRMRVHPALQIGEFWDRIGVWHMREGRENMEQRLIALRKEKGLTQAQLAEAINICRQSISDWERGVTRPTQDNLLLLSELYGVSVDYLMGKDVSPAAPAVPVPEQQQTKAPGQRLWIYRGIILILAALLVVMTLLFVQEKKVNDQRTRVIPIAELPTDRMVVFEEFD